MQSFHAIGGASYSPMSGREGEDRHSFWDIGGHPLGQAGSGPTFTGSPMATHQHDGITAGTPSGTNTPGAATSVVQPYFVVYMWKRTA
jgi:hypothetical protein